MELGCCVSCCGALKKQAAQLQGPSEAWLNQAFGFLRRAYNVSGAAPDRYGARTGHFDAEILSNEAKPSMA